MQRVNVEENMFSLYQTKDMTLLPLFMIKLDTKLNAHYNKPYNHQKKTITLLNTITNSNTSNLLLSLDRSFVNI